MLTISEVCRRARAAGMSYGKYVAIMQEEQAPAPQKLRKGRYVCEHCGGVFERNTGSNPAKHRFCCESCREQATRRKKTKK